MALAEVRRTILLEEDRIALTFVDEEGTAFGGINVDRAGATKIFDALGEGLIALRLGRVTSTIDDTGKPGDPLGGRPYEPTSDDIADAQT